MGAGRPSSARRSAASPCVRTEHAVTAVVLPVWPLAPAAPLVAPTSRTTPATAVAVASRALTPTHRQPA